MNGTSELETEYIVCSYLLEQIRYGRPLNNREAQSAINRGIVAYEKYGRAREKELHNEELTNYR